MDAELREENERLKARLAHQNAAGFAWNGHMVHGDKDSVAAVVAAISVAQGQGWRPIESAPRDGLLLTFHPRFGQRILRPDPHNAGWYLDETGGPTREATHWQPLPAAPAQPDGVE